LLDRFRIPSDSPTYLPAIDFLGVVKPSHQRQASATMESIEYNAHPPEMLPESDRDRVRREVGNIDVGIGCLLQIGKVSE